MLIVATLFFASQDALTKHLVETLPASQIVAIRFAFFMLFAAIYAGRRVGLRTALRSHTPLLQIARGLLLSYEIIVFSYAIQFLGLAEMHTIFISFPLIATALSAPLLGEHIGWRRALAVFIGFVGTLIILRPGSAVFQPASLLAVTAAFMFGLYNVLTRKAAWRDSLETSLLYLGIAGFVGAMLLAPFVWQPINRVELAWLLLISATSIIGHMLLIMALARAPAVVLQPFNYFVLVWGVIIAFLVYGEILTITSVLGAAIVIASGVFIARRDYQRNRAP